MAAPHHLCMIEDVTDKKQTEALIWQQANFDTLTQLPNRRMFHDRLRHDMLKSRRDASRIAILFIDLDHFKEVNDTLGHHQGDILLIEAARRIRACVRESDTVARLGGDEFTVILSELDDLQQSTRIAQKILDGLLAPFQLGQEQAFVSASIGITLYPGRRARRSTTCSSTPTRPCTRPRARAATASATSRRPCRWRPLNRMRLTNDLRTALKGEQLRAVLPAHRRTWTAAPSTRPKR